MNISQSECAFQSTNMDVQKYQKSVLGKSCKPCSSRLKELKRQSVKVMMIEYNKMMLGNGVPCLDGLLTLVYRNLKLSEQYLAGTSNGKCNTCGIHIEYLKKHSLLVLQTANLTPFLTCNMVAQQNEYIYKNDQLKQLPRNMASCGESSDSINGKKVQGLNQTATMEGTRGIEIKESATASPTAAHFFTEAAKKFNIPNHPKKKCGSRKKSDLSDGPLFATNFSRAISRDPPPNPPGLFKYMGRRVDGKVTVMLRIKPNENIDQGDSFIEVDQRRKQISMLQPKNLNVIPQKLQNPNNAPKLFAFDAIFEPDITQNRVASSSLLDILHAVINGGEGCLLTYGSSNVGKTATMLGQSNSNKTIGIIPSAIAWMYSLIEDCKQRTGARISVRVSAVEVVGPSENLKDLLAEQASGNDSIDSSGASPGIYLREDPVGGGVQLGNVSEPQAVSAEKAAFYLDAALASRTTEKDQNGERQSSHMIFTLHIYQYRVDKSHKSRNGGAVPYSGGRSRLHLIDLSCVNQKFHKMQNGVTPSQAGLGQIIVAMLNGFKQLPYRDSKITRLLKDSIGNPTCRTTLIAHVSAEESNYSKTCSTIQMISKIHRSRRKRNKYCSSSSDNNSCDETRRRRPHAPLVKTYGIDDCGISSDYNTSSAGEDSCDTVIYMGNNGNMSDRDLSDNERPPSPGTVNKIKLKLASSSEDESPESRMTPSTSDDEKQIDFILSNELSEKVKQLEETKEKTEKEITEGDVKEESSGDDKDSKGKDKKDTPFSFKTQDKLSIEKAVNVVAPLIVKNTNESSDPKEEKITNSDSSEEKAPSEKELRKHEKRIAKLLKENIKDDTVSLIDKQSVEIIQKTDGYSSDISRQIQNAVLKFPPKFDGYVSAPENYRSKPVQIVKGTVRPTVSCIKESSKISIFDNEFPDEFYNNDFIKNNPEISETCLDDVCSNYTQSNQNIGTSVDKTGTSVDNIETPVDTAVSINENIKPYDDALLSFIKENLKDDQIFNPEKNTNIHDKEIKIKNLDHIITVSSVPNFTVARKTLPENISSPTMSNRGLSKSNVAKLPCDLPQRHFLERSYSREDTCSVVSVNESEYDSDACSTYSASPAMFRKTRQPQRLRYRWSTVFEEDEKLNKSTSKKRDKSNDSSISIKSPRSDKKLDSKSPKSTKKFTLFSSSTSESSLTPKSNKKFSILSPKSERKLKTTDNESADKRMSACSDSSSGIGSNSSNSHSSSLQSREEVKIDYSMPEKTSKPRLWPFSRRSRKSRSYSTSGYVSDGTLIEASSARLPRRSRFFGSRSKPSLYTDGHSSGYDTTVTEGDLTSCTEDMTDNESPAIHKKKKRFLNFRRRSTSELNSSRGRVRKPLWLDSRRCQSDDEGLQIKVYEIDDPQKIKQSRCKSESVLSPSARQKKVEELKRQREELKSEINSALDKFPQHDFPAQLTRLRLYNGAQNGTPIGKRGKSSDTIQIANSLEKENQSMGKKLKAIKNHIQVVTCFDGQMRKVTQI